MSAPKGISALRVFESLTRLAAVLGYAPSISELQADLGIGRASVHHHLEKLRAQGWVTWEDGQPRTLRVVAGKKRTAAEVAALERRRPVSRPRYLYRVITNNGAGRWGAERLTLPTARTAAEKAAKNSPGYGPFEIERIEVLPNGNRRYWVRAGSRWVAWDPRRGIEDRQPDMVWR